MPKADAKTARLRAATEAAGGVWRDVGQLPEGELAALVRRDEVDVLVELTGGLPGRRAGGRAKTWRASHWTWGYVRSACCCRTPHALPPMQATPPSAASQHVVEHLTPSNTRTDALLCCHPPD